MASGTPASTLGDPVTMPGIVSNLECAAIEIALGVRLGMALETEHHIVFHKHLFVDGTMRVVTNGAALLWHWAHAALVRAMATPFGFFRSGPWGS